MCASLVITGERYLVAHNIHIIRLVMNPTSVEDVGVINSRLFTLSVCGHFFSNRFILSLGLSGCYQHRDPKYLSENMSIIRPERKIKKRSGCKYLKRSGFSLLFFFAFLLTVDTTRGSPPQAMKILLEQLTSQFRDSCLLTNPAQSFEHMAVSDGSADCTRESFVRSLFRGSSHYTDEWYTPGINYYLPSLRTDSFLSPEPKTHLKAAIFFDDLGPAP